MLIDLMSDTEKELIKITHTLSEREQELILKIVQEIVKGWKA